MNKQQVLDIIDGEDRRLDCLSMYTGSILRILSPFRDGPDELLSRWDDPKPGAFLYWVKKPGPYVDRPEYPSLLLAITAQTTSEEIVRLFWERAADKMWKYRKVLSDYPQRRISIDGPQWLHNSPFEFLGRLGIGRGLEYLSLYANCGEECFLWTGYTDGTWMGPSDPVKIRPLRVFDKSGEAVACARELFDGRPMLDECSVSGRAQIQYMRGELDDASVKEMEAEPGWEWYTAPEANLDLQLVPGLFCRNGKVYKKRGRLYSL